MAQGNVIDGTGKSAGSNATSPTSSSAARSTRPSCTRSSSRNLPRPEVGTASTKTRSEVRGGGAKPWRQKGTGRARHGSIRSPIWVGGGAVFGPKPRDYSMRVNKKMRKAALALGAGRQGRQRDRSSSSTGSIETKTKAAAKCLEAAGISGRVLVVLDPDDDGSTSVDRAFRNLAGAAFSLVRIARHLRRARRRRDRLHERGLRRVRLKRASNEGGERVMGSTKSDARDVILAPVVSEKSYSLLDENAYTFLVHPDANKTEIRQAVETIWDVQGRLGEHDQPQGQDRSVSDSPRDVGRTRSERSSSSSRATRSRSSSSRPRGVLMPIRKAKPTSPGRRFQTLLGLLRGHSERAREVAARAQTASRPDVTTTAASRRATRAAATRSATGSSISVATRTVFRPRSLTSSTTRIATLGSLSFTTRTARSATS